MQTKILWIAVVINFITFLVHTFIGGLKVAEPLLKETNLPPLSKWLSYYFRHVTSVYTFLMVGRDAYVALNPYRSELVIFLNILNAALSVLGYAVATKGNINPFHFPSTLLFASVSILGISSLAENVMQAVIFRRSCWQ